ncbi:hypothetical protein BGW38_010374, partial [Lunasporangiospora selenospora]
MRARKEAVKNQCELNDVPKLLKLATQHSIQECKQYVKELDDDGDNFVKTLWSSNLESTALWKAPTSRPPYQPMKTRLRMLRVDSLICTLSPFSALPFSSSLSSSLSLVLFSSSSPTLTAAAAKASLACHSNG